MRIATLVMLFLLGSSVWALEAPSLTSSGEMEAASPKQSLTGRWYGPDRHMRLHSQIFRITNIDVAKGTALASYYSTQSSCVRTRIPVRITWDGARMTFTPISKWDVPPCLTTMDGKLIIQPDGRYIGQLKTGGQTYSVVDLVLQ